MIAVDSDLPPDSDLAFVSRLRETLAARPPVVGVMTLVEDDRILSHRAWEGTPVLIALEFFGMRIDEENYRAVVERRLELGPDGPERPDVLVGPNDRLAFVNVVENKSIGEIEELLTRKRA